MTTENVNLPVPVSDDLPEYLKGDLAQSGQTGEGYGTLRAKDIEIPRIALMQALSPEVNDGLFRQGDLVHSINKELIAEGDRPAGPDKPATPAQRIRFIVIKHFLQWIEWIPRDKGGGIKEMSIDVNSALAKRCEAGEKVKDDKGNEVPAVVEYHNFIIYAPEVSDFPLLVCCGKTNWKHGKNLLSRAIMRGPQFPIFAGAYELSSAREKNKAGQEYRVFHFVNAGWASEAEYAKAKQIFEFVKDKEVKTTMDETDGAAAQGEYADKDI